MSEWRPLSRFFVRSAGFPFAVADMRSPAMVAALAELGGTHGRLQALQAQFADAEFPAALERQDRDGGDRAAFKALYRVRRDVQRGLPLGPRVERARTPAAWAATWDRAVEAVAGAERTVDREAERAHAAARAALHELAAEPGFREAVAFSSPGAFERVVAHADRPASGARARQRDRLLYAYAQRLATKNETTSWFGPIDYGRVAGPGSALVLRHGAGRPRRWARLTHWSVEAIAAAICRDPAVHDALPLTLRPGWILREPQGLLVAAPAGRAVGADEAEIAVLRACERGITSGSLRACAPPAELAALDRPMARRIVAAELVVPASVDDPSEWLDVELARLADAGGGGRVAPARGAAHAAGRLRALRGSARDERLERLRELETDFAGVVGVPARRGEGAHYADRLVVTEDCRGDLARCDLGEDGCQRTGRPARPVPRAERDYALLVRDAIAARARDIHARLAAEGEVPFLASRRRSKPRSTSSASLTRIPASCAGWTPWTPSCVRPRGTMAAHASRPATSPISCARCPTACSPRPTSLPSTTRLARASTSRRCRCSSASCITALRSGRISARSTPSATRSATRWPPLFRPTGRMSPRCCAVASRARLDPELPGTVVELRTRATHPLARAVRAEALTVDLEAQEPRLRLPSGEPLHLRPRHPRGAPNWLFGLPPLVAPPLLRHAAAAPRIVVGDVIAWRRRWTLAARGTRRAARRGAPVGPRARGR